MGVVLPFESKLMPIPSVFGAVEGIIMFSEYLENGAIFNLVFSIYVMYAYWKYNMIPKFAFFMLYVLISGYINNYVCSIIKMLWD